MRDISIFVSSRRSTYRAAALQAVSELHGFRADGFENWPATPLSSREACLDGVGQCELYLGVFLGDYSGPTAEEYDEARRLRKPRLIFLGPRRTADPKQAAFLGSIADWSDGDFRIRVDSAGDLKYEIQRALGDSISLFIPRYLSSLNDECGRVSLRPFTDKSVNALDLVAPRLERMEEGVRRALSFEEAVGTYRRVLIIGASGSGKTTGVHRLIAQLATERATSGAPRGTGNVTPPTPHDSPVPIPILLPLVDYSGDLLAQLVGVLDHSGVRVPSVDSLLQWIGRNRVLLVLDGLDQVDKIARLERDLDRLLKRSENLQLLVLSQAFPSNTLPRIHGLETWQMSPLTDGEVKQLLSLYLDRSSAASLYDALMARQMIEPLRLPLMATLATVAVGSGETERCRPPTRGALYSDAVQFLLRGWGDNRVGSVSEHDVADKLTLLGEIGYAMLCRRATALPRESALRILTRALDRGTTSACSARDILDEFAALGLVIVSRQGVQFRHPSFRPYFAALWMSNNPSLRLWLRLVWRSSFVEAVPFLASCLEGERLGSMFRWLYMSATVALRIAGAGGSRWATDRVFQLLYFASECPTHRDAWREEVVSLLPSRTPYLSESGLSSVVSYFGSFEDIYASFYSLVGQLQTASALRYVARTGGRYAPFGLVHFRTRAGADALLSQFRGDNQGDLVAEHVAAETLLGFPAEVFCSAAIRFLKESDPPLRCSLLRGFSVAAAWRNTGARDRPIPMNDDRWIEFLSRLAVDEASAEVREGTLAVLKMYGDQRWRLPATAEKIFAEVLAGGDGDERRGRCAWFLVYGSSEESRRLLIRALKDDSEWVALYALHALRFRDSRGFPGHVVMLVEKHGEAYFREDSRLREDIAGRVAETEGMAGERGELLMTLLCHLVLSAHPDIRLACAVALGAIRAPAAGEFLRESLRADGSEGVRGAAFAALQMSADGPTELDIERAMSDAAPRVRSSGVVALAAAPRELGELFAAKLRVLSERDADPNVRRDAKMVLGEIERGER